MSLLTTQMPVATDATDQVLATLGGAPILGKMVRLTGRHGWGKSEALKLAQQKLDRLVIVAMTPMSSTPRGFWSTVAQGVGVEIGRSDGAADLSSAASRELARTGDTLVLDHCEHLRPAAMVHLRHLIDVVKTVVVVGGPEMDVKLAGLADLGSRCSLMTTMAALTRAEAHRLLGEEFSTDWIDVAHLASFGDPKNGKTCDGFGWSTLSMMANIERQVATKRQVATSDFNGDQARQTAKLRLGLDVPATRAA